MIYYLFRGISLVSAIQNPFFPQKPQSCIELEKPGNDRSYNLIINYFLVHSLNIQVTVHVLDGNDHSPVFDPALYPIAISESTTVGSTIVRVFASDNDIGSNAMLSYNITTGNASGDLHSHVSTLYIWLKKFNTISCEMIIQ